MSELHARNQRLDLVSMGKIIYIMKVMSEFID